MYDYIIVGSGCSGSIAALTLIEEGASVLMIDVGLLPDQRYSSIPDQDFVSIRKTEANQSQYFIGDNGEGIDWSDIGKGAQLTPPRLYIKNLTDQYLPVQSDNFFPLESLGYGGLGIGWGLQCWEYSKSDSKKVGLDINLMSNAYEWVSQKIGISASNDSATQYTIGDLETYQPSANMDRAHSLIMQRYLKNEVRFINKGVRIGRTPLALLTKDVGTRKAYQYHDMDYYSNSNLSAWRPYITVDELRKNPKFEYINSQLVLSFSEHDDEVIISSININSKEKTTFKCRKLILASGAIGTARLSLRSLSGSETRLPILCNPHTYIPCIQMFNIGKGIEPNKLGLGQLSYFIDPEGNDSGISVATSYSYQSLMLFRIINQIPLGYASARIIMRYLMSGLVIMIVQHPDKLSSAKYIRLKPDSSEITNDKLVASFSLNDVERSKWSKREKMYTSIMRRLGTYPIKRVKTEYGSSIHYAGTLPFSKAENKFSLSDSGRIHGTRHIYVADSSGFKYLPAKGLTFSLMANARITALNAIKSR